MEIPLIKSDRVAIIDDADHDLVRSLRWWLHGDGYAVSYVGPASLYMHRVIMAPPAELEVDHRNGEPSRLDNRRANLRLATRSQQNVNRPRPSNTKSPYRGVSFHSPSGRWCARVKFEGITTSLGYYETPEDAARAYNMAAPVIHGDFAQLNPVDGPPPRQCYGVSGYRGVYPYNNSGRWQVRIGNHLVGVFDDPGDAARVYDAAIIAKDGIFGRLNFPLEALRAAQEKSNG